MSGNAKFRFLLAPIVLTLLVVVSPVVSWAGELEDAQEAVRQNPNYAYTHFDLVLAYAKVGKYQEAIASFKESWSFFLVVLALLARILSDQHKKHSSWEKLLIRKLFNYLVNRETKALAS